MLRMSAGAARTITLLERSSEVNVTPVALPERTPPAPVAPAEMAPPALPPPPAPPLVPLRIANRDWRVWTTMPAWAFSSGMMRNCWAA